MKSFTSTLIFGLTALAILTDAKAGDLSQMIRANDMQKLQSKIRDSYRLETLKAQCDIQLKYEMLPTSCFEVISIEKNDGILTSAKFEKTKSWLSENCRDRLLQIRDISDLQRRQLKFLPADCQRLAREKMIDQKYRDVSMNPASLFKKRL